MFFQQVKDPQLSQYAYLIGCQQTGEALVIDPERDIDRYEAIADAEGLKITAAAETHVHADFLSGVRAFAHRGATAYLSAEGGAAYPWTEANEVEVRRLRDGDTFSVGQVELEAVHTPGHTPEHLSFLITDRGGGADAPMGIATGDFVFTGALGRPDLLETAAGQEGAMDEGAAALYQSARRFEELDDYLQVWPGHGAGSACGKALGAVPVATVGYERRTNPALRAARGDEPSFKEFILDGQPVPPLYFARMKRQNTEGPPLLDELPAPKALSADDLGALADSNEATVIDARLDRAAFMEAHLLGAIYAPWDQSFATIAGSYVEPDAPVYLLIKEDALEDAVRTLVRLGLDDVRGAATPETLTTYVQQGGRTQSIERIDFEALEHRRTSEGMRVLDVRSPEEYDAGHVPGAQLAPHTRLPEHLAELPTDEPLLVHCGGGLRASSAVSLLARHGYSPIHVDDRFSNYREQGNPVNA